MAAGLEGVFSEVAGIVILSIPFETLKAALM
jgi:hypothetical protein